MQDCLTMLWLNNTGKPLQKNLLSIHIHLLISIYSQWPRSALWMLVDEDAPPIPEKQILITSKSRLMLKPFASLLLIVFQTWKQFSLNTRAVFSTDLQQIPFVKIVSWFKISLKKPLFEFFGVLCPLKSKFVALQ